MKTKKYELGDMWSDDFDYQGMLEYALNIESLNLYQSQKLLESLVFIPKDVNYSSLADKLWDFINSKYSDKNDVVVNEKYAKIFLDAVKELLGIKLKTISLSLFPITFILHCIFFILYIIY